MRLGSHTAIAGDSDSDTANTVDTCCKKMKVNTKNIPMKMCTPMPRCVFRAATHNPNKVITMMEAGLATLRCCSIW